MSSRVLATAWEPEKLLFLEELAYISVSEVMFCKQFLAYIVNTDGSAFSCDPINLQVGLKIYLC